MAKDKESRNPYEIVMDASFKDEEEDRIDVNDPLGERASKRPVGYKPVSDEFDDTKSTLPQKEVDRLMGIYGTSLVHEFGDDYHSEEQDPLIKRGRSIPRLCGSLVMFVEACRDYFNILNEYAYKQTSMPPSLVLDLIDKGSWKLDWLTAPQMNKSLRRKCDLETIVPYIVDQSADLSALESIDEERELYSTGTENIDFENPEEVDKYRREILPPDMYNKLFVQHNVDDVEDPVYSPAILPEELTVKILDNKESRKFAKDYEALSTGMRGVIKRRRADRRETSLIGGGFMSRYNDDFELIDDFEKYFGSEEDRPPEFTMRNIMGSEHDDELGEYFQKVDEYLDGHEMWDDGRGHTISRQEYQERRVRDAFEAAGINVRKFVNFTNSTDPDKVHVELLPTDIPKPKAKQEKLEALLFEIYKKNENKIEKRIRKNKAKAKKRRDNMDECFGGGYVGSDDDYYNDTEGDMLDQAMKSAMDQSMADYFDEQTTVKHKDIFALTKAMEDMSWENIMSEGD